MCTTMIITKGATLDGSMLVAHSDDDELSDQRVVYVPAADHKRGSKRPILKEDYPYPRMVRKDRGPGYDTCGWDETAPIGFIPQISHTYAYFDGNYGIMNEHNLMIGECTNGANYEPENVSAAKAKETGQPMRLLYSAELSRVALERCKSAHKAVELMGALIDKYGFYSTGETLLVADHDEAWVFEMCALPHQQHHSAWVAQRVPDGEVFVAANTFRIRTVSPDNPDQLFSRHLFAGVKALKWWSPKNGELDWLKTVSPGEYGHPYYSLRRIWRVFDRVNPDLGLSPWVTDTYTSYYPFSVKPRNNLSLEQVFDLYRDHYQGTEFDNTRGIAAGPFGDPHRFTGPYDENQNDNSDGTAIGGAWERNISVFYQGYSFVCQSRPLDDQITEDTSGIMWFAPDVAYTSVFAPFYSKCLGLPDSYQKGNPREFNRDIAWWAFDFVANWARLNFQRMCQVDIRPLQKILEQQSIAGVEETDRLIKRRPKSAKKIATRFHLQNAELILRRWWNLADQLIAKYSDGYINRHAMDRHYAVPLGYPASWLKHTDYEQGPTTYAMRSKQ